jgi:hypothetical protein
MGQQFEKRKPFEKKRLFENGQHLRKREPEKTQKAGTAPGCHQKRSQLFAVSS